MAGGERRGRGIITVSREAMIRLLLVGLIATTVGCDRVTKQLAASALSGTPGRSFLADTIRLQYAENTGGFLSLGADLPAAARTLLFTVLTGLALLLLIGMAFQLRRRVWALTGLTLFIAGGASNWLDRLASGRVIDFINLGIGPVRTGIFNLADVAIMLGCALLVVTETWPASRPEAESLNPRV